MGEDGSDFDEFIVDDTGMMCLAAGVGGVLVPESAQIVEVCQDPNDLNIVFMRVTVTGPYLYTPVCTVKADGGERINVDGYFVSNYKAEGVSSFPIDLDCASKTVLLAYRMGSAIPQFASVKELEITLRFNGDSSGISEDPVVQDIFTSVNPEDMIVFAKGLSPDPFLLFLDPTSGKLKIQFANLGDIPCQCAIDCVVPSEDDFGITVCEDEIQEITVDKTSIVGDPTLINLVFRDSTGNVTNVDVQAMLGVDPRTPGALRLEVPNRVNVNLFYETTNASRLDPTKLSYQIWKYKNNQDNAFIFKDWSSKPWTTFVDDDVESGQEYGYAVRFRGEFRDVSNFSSWTAVEIP